MRGLDKQGLTTNLFDPTPPSGEGSYNRTTKLPDRFSTRKRCIYSVWLNVKPLLGCKSKQQQQKDCWNPLCLLLKPSLWSQTRQWLYSDDNTRDQEKKKRKPPRQVTKCHFHLSSASSRSVFNTTVVRQLQGNTHTGWFSRKGQPVLKFHATQLLGHFTSWCLIVRILQRQNGSSFKRLNCSQSKPPILHHLDLFSIDRK